MTTIGFGICLVISVLVVIYMAQKNYNNIDIYYWSIMLLIPIINSAYFLRSIAITEETAKVTAVFMNLDGTLLLVLAIFTMLRGIGIKIGRFAKVFAYVLAFAHLALIMCCVHNNLYYSGYEDNNGMIAELYSGPLKIVHYIFLVCMSLVFIGILVTGHRKMGRYSHRALRIYAIVAFISTLMYVLEKVLKMDQSLLPYIYAVTSVLISMDYDYMHIHDISGVISMHYDDKDAERGYVALGLKKEYLGGNAKSNVFLPFWVNQRIDSVIDTKDEAAQIIAKLVDDFNEGKASSAEYKIDNMICMCEISNLSVRKDGKKLGYLLDIRDVTVEKRNLEILTNYNEILNSEVASKTQHIKGIQRKIVLGMANMIENRDNNTGGHVKRTSDIISIIVDEIQKQGKIELDAEVAAQIVRAAPMHDLGKLHIDSAILCKPARLTDEEFEIMKTHSTKSGEMVMILLDGVEEEFFVKTSYNLARYHHERWDGKGYPEGLVGSMIPLEARIMAVADVYDALVSKRCYKEAMSFEKASEIMCEGMGTQFDPGMKSVFLGCRDRLEEYYKKANAV